MKLTKKSHLVVEIRIYGYGDLIRQLININVKTFSKDILMMLNALNGLIIILWQVPAMTIRFEYGAKTMTTSKNFKY